MEQHLGFDHVVASCGHPVVSDMSEEGSAVCSYSSVEGSIDFLDSWRASLAWTAAVVSRGDS